MNNVFLVADGLSAANFIKMERFMNILLLMFAVFVGYLTMQEFKKDKL